MAQDPRQTIIDMTPEGQFKPPPRPSNLFQITGLPALIAIGAVVLAIGALALWLAITLIPLLLILAVLAYAMARYRRWRGRAVARR